VFAIGPSLREARSRRGLSAEDVQKAIRIRGRYLTAIEEERWDLLPGDAYTKGFLRTYAEFLGLDGSLYLEEYKARHLQREDQPFVPESLAPIGSARIGLLRVVLAVVAIVAAIGAVAAWQLGGSGNHPSTGAPPAAAAPAAPTTSEPSKPAATHKAKPAPARTTVTPTRAVLSATRGRVWLLVREGSATGKVLFEGILEQGKTLPVSLAQRVWFRVGAPWNLDVRIGGKVAAGLPGHPGNVVLTASGLSPAA
jgi:cytoskeleton protein RodZ